MLNYLFRSQHSFQDNLQEFLSTDSSTLNDPLIHKIMTALRGEDSSVKSQIAFAALKKAISSFDISKGEMRVLPELIILDKLVEENIYCEEISKTTFFVLDSNKTNSERSLSDETFRLLRLYWRIVKDKSKIIFEHEHIFHQKRSQRKHYLQRLKLPNILNQISTLQSFFNAIFQLIYYLQNPEKRKQDQWKKGEIGKYIIIHLLYKLLGLYSCQIMAQRYLIHKIAELNHNQIFKLKKIIQKFKENCKKFIDFIKKHEKDKFFGHIHHQEIKLQMNDKLIKFIDEYLQSLEEQSSQATLKKLPNNMGKIFVQKKPMNNIGKSQLNSRLLIKPELTNRQDKSQANSFTNWHNNFSHQFPQKQIMTVDLILQIKLQQSLSNKKEQGNQSFCKQKYFSRCSYDNRSTNVTSNYEVHYLARKQYFINQLEKVNYQNIYSKMPSKWNYF